MGCCHHCCSNCCCSSSCSVPAEQRHLCLTLFSNAQLRWQVWEFPLKLPVLCNSLLLQLSFSPLPIKYRLKARPQCKVKGFNWLGKTWSMETRLEITGAWHAGLEMRLGTQDWAEQGTMVNKNRGEKTRQAKIQKWIFRSQRATTCYLVQVNQFIALTELQVCKGGSMSQK